MQIVGIDFGTTNIRISTRDSEDPEATPRPQVVGPGDSKNMAAVVAIVRRDGDEPEVIVGEDADSREDISGQQMVLRNLKRYALQSDSYVGSRIKEVDDWWDPDKRTVHAFGKEYPISALMSQMLKKALDTAGIKPGFEWIAGCPVHAGVDYRMELAQIINDLGGVGRGEIHRIVEEPILLLLAAHKLDRLDPDSSYIVYDLGGGSFDCALAQIENVDTENSVPRMVVYGAHGDPALGGSDIDAELKVRLDYRGSELILRQAKETIGPENPTLPLPGGKNLAWEDMRETVQNLTFLFKTTVTMRATYRDAKIVWRRLDTNEPVGEIIERNPATRVVRFVSQLGWEDLKGDVDSIILSGGPTKSTIFAEGLKDRFGEEAVVSISDLLPEEIEDPVLTAISVGACYAWGESYNPLYVRRLPVRVELEDLYSGEKAEYPPYFHMGNSMAGSAMPFISPSWVDGHTDRTVNQDRLELTVTAPNGTVLEQHKVDEYIDTRQIGSRVHLIINRMGQVGIQQVSATGQSKTHPVIQRPPWQTDFQLRAFLQLQENERERRERGRERFNQIQCDTLWA